MSEKSKPTKKASTEATRKRKSQNEPPKTLTINITSRLLNSFSGCKIIDCVEKYDLELNTLRQFEDLKKFTITWTRKLNNDPNSFQVEKIEPFLMIVLNAEEFVDLVKKSKLQQTIISIKDLYKPTTDFTSSTLIVQGLRNYCKNHPKQIGMKEIEIHLTQIQLLANCCHRLLETPEDVALTVGTMSKSIADEPMKVKQNEKYMNEQLLFSNDVKCEAKKQDKISLSNLWQKQMTTINAKVSFEVAESIRKKYPMPENLIAAYDSEEPESIADCTLIQKNCLMAKDKKRIGPALDRKMRILMTSENPDEVLQ